MRSAHEFSEFAAAWTGFLHALDRAWNKLEALAPQAGSRFKPWAGSHRNRRTNDELLCYLWHARNVDEHTLQEVVEHQPGSFSFLLPASPAKDLYIEYLEIDGPSIKYRGSQPPRIEVTPPRVALLPVTDRGVQFDVPRVHLGKGISEGNPIEAAELGLRYYSNAIDEAYRKFFAEDPSAPA